MVITEVIQPGDASEEDRIRDVYDALTLLRRRVELLRHGLARDVLLHECQSFENAMEVVLP